MRILTKEYTLDGSGTEIDNFDVEDVYEQYIVNGTAIAIGNYNISIAGTPTKNDIFIFKWRGSLDITTNSATFAILGQSITANQLLYDFDAIATYNGTTWDVLIDRSSTSVTTETTNIANDAVTNAILAEVPTMTVKANVTGGTTNPQDVSISTFFGTTAWKVLGNSGLTAGTNFLGTTDNVDLVFKRNSVLSGTIGATNTGFGESTFLNITNNGLNNTAIGVEALTLLTTGDDNTAIGYGSLASSATSSNNTAIGAYSLTNNTLGTNNTAVGLAALNINVTGSQNTAVGLQALNLNNSGDYNSALGVSALLANTTGDNNTAFGASSLSVNTIGADNTAVGRNTAGTIQTGSYNTVIGSDADVDSNSSLNRIALGYGALADSDFQFAIPDDVTSIKWRGVSYTLPAADGTAGQSLKTDGAGTLYWG